MGKSNPVCHDEGFCFAQEERERGRFYCTILSKTYPKGVRCPFSKPVAYMTNGKRYGYNPQYGKDYQTMENEQINLEYWK